MNGVDPRFFPPGKVLVVEAASGNSPPQGRFVAPDHPLAIAQHGDPKLKSELAYAHGAATGGAPAQLIALARKHGVDRVVSEIQRMGLLWIGDDTRILRAWVQRG